LGLFGSKKADQPSGDGAPAAPAGGGLEFSPEKAQRFFERAQTVHDATNYDYAMNCWLSGLRFDPGSMAGLEGFFKSAGAYMNAGAKGPSKENLRAFSGRTPLERYLYALLDWSGKPFEAAHAVDAVKQAAGLGLSGPTAWIAERALGAVMRDKKPRKDHFLAILEATKKVERWDLAVQAGEAAVRMDPADGKLAADVRNLSANATMTKGGFDQTGQQGGFRSNVRDAEKQKRLEEESRVTRTDEVQARLIATAKGDYLGAPQDRPLINKYVQLLLERDAPEDQEEALRVLDKAHADLKEFRFREMADALRLKQFKRSLRRLKEAAEAPGAPESAAAEFRAKVREYAEADLRAAEAQSAAYPTDLTRRFELGKKYFALGKYEEAIGALQEAKADPKNRSAALTVLGQAFQKIGWNDEAVETLRAALGMHSNQDDVTGMELRYALMLSLMARAAEMSSLSDAEDSYKIAASIAIQQINYKDIRARRDEIKALVARLKGGTSPA
jgi:tetratricopeptide (TPR) repeat protein